MSTKVEFEPVAENWVVLHLRLRGISPLLMHNPAVMRSGDSPKRKTVPAPEDEARRSCYTRDGYLVVPADCVRQSIVNASKILRVGRRTLYSAFAGGLDTLLDCFPLTRDGKPLAESDYTIDTRRVVVQRQGIIRARARIDLPWDCEATFRVDVTVIPEVQTVVRAAQEAGLRYGLLDYRPERGGRFGRFTVVEAYQEEV